MDKKFDSIVNFSELGDFIKAPLRTYSSGMVARLGFATAIQVEPDILLLDEVLAVGDGAFQKKCLDEINRFKAKGVTILFVSHAMDQVRRTCEKALWLDRGAAKAWGDSDSVLKQYEQYMASLTKKN